MELGNQEILVVGAGPVGALAALYAARRGHDVAVYEMRDDLRLDTTTPLHFTKSINLALSERGINSIRQAGYPGLLNSILEYTIPMHGRMIHGRDKQGRLFEQPQKYDAHGRFIRAADRASLNKYLLEALAAHPNVSLHFNRKLTGLDMQRGRNVAWFEQPRDGSPSNNQQEYNDLPESARQRPQEIAVPFNLIIGADGAHSALRSHLMRYNRMSYNQSYIDTLWCEFHIAPAPLSPSSSSEKQQQGETDFAISPSHLHIWPASTHMFIAIPSADGSFTCTLFASTSHFTHLESDPAQHLTPFFEQHFPGIVDVLIERAELLGQFARNPHLPLMSVECAPYHYCSPPLKDSIAATAAGAVILGDAAHAMVPFYGQGMNAGLESTRVLFDHLDALPDLNGALESYTAERHPDALTITALAQQNYTEMRDSVVHSPLYLLRKAAEEYLSVRAPWSGFRTRYARVSFGNERYSDVERAVAWQGRVLEAAAAGVGLGFFGGLAWGLARWRGLGPR